MRPPSYLLGVVAPGALTARVDAFRASSGASRESPPHVTVKARSGLGADLAWLAAARHVAAQTSPFEVAVGGAGLFARRAVYLQVQSQALIDLHVALLDALKPPQRFGYEGRNMTPHLTLAQARRSLDLEATYLQAKGAFSDLELAPCTFTVTELWLFVKPGPGGIYAPTEALPLAPDRPVVTTPSEAPFG